MTRGLIVVDVQIDFESGLRAEKEMRDAGIEMIW